MLKRSLIALICLLVALPAGAYAGKRDTTSSSTKGKPSKTTTTEPAPTEPAPTEPAPTEPAPTEPAPTDPAPTTPAHLFGYNDIAVQTGQISAAAHATLAASGGAKTQRITFDWRWAEQVRGTFKFDVYDRLYNAYTAAGMKPIFVVLYSPQWSWAEGTPCVQATQDCRFPPAAEHMDGFRNMIQTLVKRYPQMAALEVWNEPNLKMFWQSGPDPAHYAMLVKEADAAVAAAGSTVPVLGGSVTVSGAAGTMDLRAFLTGMYDAGVKGRMDGLSIHPYPNEVDPWLSFRTLTTAREVRDIAGDTATPIWITEIGSSSDQVGLSNQARLLERLVTRYGAESDIRSTIVHSLVAPNTSNAFEAGYGVVGSNLLLKPAYCTLAKLNGILDPCAALDVILEPVQEKRWAAQELLQNAVEAAQEYRRANGSYTGLTSAKLAELDPSLSAQAGDGQLAPGAAADPSKIGVFVWGTAPQHMEVCNTSQADRSYCVHTVHGQYWDYGSAAGNFNTAAGATNNRTSTSW